jgi:hypothetical protein
VSAGRSSGKSRSGEYSVLVGGRPVSTVGSGARGGRSSGLRYGYFVENGRFHRTVVVAIVPVCIVLLIL